MSGVLINPYVFGVVEATPDVIPFPYSLVAFHSHFDGADAATAATDESNNAHAMTFNGGAQIDTAQSVFGGASLLIDETTNDYVSVPDSPAFDFEDNDFTIEFWARFNGDPGTDEENFVSKWDLQTGNQASWAFQFFNNLLRFVYTTNGSTAVVLTVPWNPIGETWYHLAVTRSGSDLLFFVDGVQQGTTQNIGSDIIFSGTSPLWIGTVRGSSGFSAFHDGWLDELRVVNGYPVYASAFTPPTEEYNFHRYSLLCNFDGIDGQATDYKSQDKSERVSTFVGNAQLDTAQARFGSSSLRVDGTGDRVTFPSSTDFDFGSEPFTIECFARWSSLSTASETLVAKWNATLSEKSWSLLVDTSTNTLQLLLSSNGSTTVTKVNESFTPSLNQWYHVSASFDGVTYRVFVDGAQLGSGDTTAVALHVNTGVLSLGDQADGADPFDGWLDSVRVTKGEALYVANFTPPSVDFPRHVSQDFWDSALLLSFDGADGQTFFTSEDRFERIVTFNGNAQLDTASPRFGSAALLLDGNGDYVSLARDPDFILDGSRDFTAECFVRVPSSPPANQTIFDQGGQFAQTFPNWGLLLFSTDVLGARMGTTNLSAQLLLTGTTTVTPNVWHHVAITYEAATDTGRLFLDGSLEASGTVTAANLFDNTALDLLVGYSTGQPANNYFNGAVEEIRISPGVARYTAAFTAPAAPFPKS